MEKTDMEKVSAAWPVVANFVVKPKNEEEFRLLCDLMDDLLHSGIDENHPLDSLLDHVSELVEEYEKVHVDMDDEAGNLSPADMLAFLMEQRNLKQRELIPVFGSQGSVSEILSGKRRLNLNHIEKLSDFFGVPKSLFL